MADSGLTFEIAVEGGVDGDAVLAKTPIQGLAVLGTDPPGGRWYPDEIRFFDRERATIRPVEVSVGRRTIEVSVFAGGSAEDAEMAAALATAVASVASSHVRSPELDEVLLPDDFRARHRGLWAKQFEQESFQRLLARADQRFLLPSLRGPLAIGPRLAAQVRRAPDPALALRDALRRVVWIDGEDVHVGHTTITPVGEREVRTGSWARGVPTLLAAGVLHAVALEDGHSTLNVACDALVDALDRDATWLTDDLLLVPGLDGPPWDALVARLRAGALADVTALAGPRLVAEQPDSAQIDEWTRPAVEALDRAAQDALRRGVVIAVLIVAGADGVIETSELDAFRAWLGDAVKRPGPMAALFPGGAADAVHLLESTTRSKVPASALFVTTLAAVKGHVSRRARHAYAEELRALALQVAEASSGTGWLAFLRPRVSREERSALDTLDAMLARISAA